MIEVAKIKWGLISPLMSSLIFFTLVIAGFLYISDGIIFAYNVNYLPSLNLVYSISLEANSYFFILFSAAAFIIFGLLTAKDASFNSFFHLASFAIFVLVIFSSLVSSNIVLSLVQLVIGAIYFLLAVFGQRNVFENGVDENSIKVVSRFVFVLFLSAVLQMVWTLGIEEVSGFSFVPNQDEVLRNFSKEFLPWVYLISVLAVLPGFPIGGWFFASTDLDRPQLFILKNIILSSVLFEKVPIAVKIIGDSKEYVGTVFSTSVIFLLVFSVFRLLLQKEKKLLIPALTALPFLFVFIRLGIASGVSSDDANFFLMFSPLLACFSIYILTSNWNNKFERFVFLLILISFSALPGTPLYRVFSVSINATYGSNYSSFLILSLIWMIFFSIYIYLSHLIFWELAGLEKTGSDKVEKCRVLDWQQVYRLPLIVVFFFFFVSISVSLFWGVTLF